MSNKDQNIISIAAPNRDQPIDTDFANARRFVHQHGDSVRWTPERGWLHWDGKRWAADKLHTIEALARDTAETIYDEIRQSAEKEDVFRWAKKSQSGRAVKEMLFLARTYDGISVYLSQFDSDPWLLNCMNGILDLKSGTLKEHDPAELCSRIAPVNYDPNARAPLWQKFMVQITGSDENLQRFLQQAAGYSLTGSIREQVLFFCYGHGANGKSVFIETLQALLGEYAVTARTETITTRRDAGIPNDLARLAGPRLVTINETAENQKLHEPLVKDMTGGDTMTARFLRREYFDFRPEFKLWLRGNHKPEIHGTDEGIWRRMRLIPFEVMIPAEERDPDLAIKLRDELPGILAWAVRGCLEWQKVGLQVPAIVYDAVADYRSEMDIVGQFLQDRCNLRRFAEIKASALYSAYRDWAIKSGESPATQTKFGKALSERGFRKSRSRAGWLYQGVELHDVRDFRDEV